MKEIKFLVIGFFGLITSPCWILPAMFLFAVYMWGVICSFLYDELTKMENSKDEVS